MKNRLSRNNIKTDHLGNTRIVFSPRDQYFKYIHFASDFYPYGKILREYVVGDQERYLTTQHERDQETGLDYRGARYYDSDVARFLSIDPLATKYPGFSDYAYCFDNPINYFDNDGKEGVPVRNLPFVGIEYPAIKPYQWYTLNGSPLSGSFNSAAIYNTKNNNAWAYTNISERHDYYNWADKQLAGKSKWFAAAGIVTSWNAVGAADRTNAWYLSDPAEKFLQQGNKNLFYYNMNNFKNLQNGTLNNSFTNANGKNISFKGLSGKQLDYALVEYEQTKVQLFIKQYQEKNPDVDMSKVFQSINNSFQSTFLGIPLSPSSINDVFNENFNTENGQKSFDFSNYDDRVKLGIKLIDKLY